MKHDPTLESDALQGEIRTFRPWLSRVPAPVQILALAVLLCLGYGGALSLLGWQTELAENNLQSNLLRILKYYNEPSQEVVLAGTSITGRLLPSFFEEKDVKVASLGLDGGTTLFALEVFANRKLLPKRLLVETNLLFRNKGENDKLLAEALDSGTSRMSRWFPLFRPEYRVSAVIYTLIKKAHDAKSAHTPPPPSGAVATEVAKHATPSGPPSEAESRAYREVSECLRAIQKRGVEIALVRIPSGKDWERPASGLSRQLAKELNLRFIDLGPIIAAHGEGMVFTDGVHLSLGSAKLVVAELLDEDLSTRKQAAANH